jgi:hypothetical protein
VFTSDHGEYASAHGLQGKGFAVYKECLNVVDPRGDSLAAPEAVRTHLASSVDLLPLLVSVARNGTHWMSEEPYAALYGKRARLFDILVNPEAPGRKYALYTMDEPFYAGMNYLHAPEHVIGVVAEQGKLGTYAFWNAKTDSGESMKAGMEVEYFDYSQPEGMLEMTNTADSKASKELLHTLLTELLPHELRQSLPEKYQAAQQTALDSYWKYVKGSGVMSIIAGRKG